MSSNFCVSSNLNKKKTHVITNVSFNRVSSRASISTNPNISKIDHVDITINEKDEKYLHLQIKNERPSELNQSFQNMWVAKFPWGKLIGLDCKRQKV